MIRALKSLGIFELGLFFTSPMAVFFTYLFPASILASSLIAKPKDPAGTVEALLPMLVGFVIVFVSFFTVTTQIVAYRELGFYKRILATKIDTFGIVISNAFRGFTVILLGFAFLSAEAILGFGAVPSINLPQAILAIFLVGTCLILIAVTVACFVRRSATMFPVAVFASYLFIGTSGLRPDLGRWSEILDSAIRYLPSYHAFELLKAGFRGGLFSYSVLPNLIVIAGFALIGILIIRRRLSWM